MQSIFQLDVFEQRLNAITNDMASYDLIIDLVEAGPPTSEIRERLKHLFGAQKKLRRAAVVTGNNFMLKVAAKFVLGGSIGLKNFSVHQTCAEAITELRLGKRE